MPDDPALRYIAQRLDDMGADLKETRKEVSELSSRDRADLLRFEDHAARLARLERGALWIIGIVIAAVVGTVLTRTGITL